MKIKSVILFLVLFGYFGLLKAQEINIYYLRALSPKYNNKILKDKDLYKLLKDIPNDKMLQFERIVSYLFHQLLNQYRIENNLKPLGWDNRLWLAARNHNIYMANEEYNHIEYKKNSLYFTGKEPESRIAFVAYTPIVEEYYCTAENILWFKYWHNSFCIPDIAEIVIQTWKDSPGHNANMLRPCFGLEATSIYFDIKSNKFYGTSLFSNEVLLSSKPISLSWNKNLENIYKDYKGEDNDTYCGDELDLGN